jgi:hypothetical protein
MNRIIRGVGIVAVIVGVVGFATVAKAQQTDDQRQPITEQNRSASFASCQFNAVSVGNGVPTASGVPVIVALSGNDTVVVHFNSENQAPSGGSMNVDWSVDGNPPVVAGAEFWSSDNPFFGTRHSMGVFSLGAGVHTIEPIVTAFGGAGTIFYRCASVQ